jgi:hypothetical protein
MEKKKLIKRRLELGTKGYKVSLVILQRWRVKAREF